MASKALSDPVDENNGQEDDQDKLKDEEQSPSGGEEEESEDDDPLYAELEAKYDLKVEKAEEQAKYDTFARQSRENTVDLSNLNLRYNARQSSALRPVLVDYGMNDPTRERRKREKQKRAQRKRRESEGDENNKEKEKEEYYIGVYDSLHALRDRYYRVYLEKLQERVAEQRKQIKQRSIELEDKLARQNQRQTPEKKLEHHTLDHDDAFLQNVAKSETYKLVCYEEKLRQKGKLRYQEDVQEFWRMAREDTTALRSLLKREKIEEIKDPVPAHISSSQHGSHLSDSFSTRSSSYASLQQPAEQQRTHPVPPRPLTQIEEAKESSRPSTRDPQSWAITGQVQAKHGEKSQPSSYSPITERKISMASRRPTQTTMGSKKSVDSKLLDPYQKARLAAKHLDELFPQQDLPPMSCFNIDLTDQDVNAEEIIAQLKKERREKERKLFVKRIRKMYHLSQANHASTQRIMAKHGDEFEMALEGPDMDTLLSSYDKPPQPPKSIEERLLEEKPWLRHIRHRAIVPIAEESETPRSNETRTKSTTSRSSSKSKKAITKPPSPLPALDIETVEQKSKIVEAKCMSTNWTNYLGVGKSIFAK